MLLSPLLFSLFLTYGTPVSPRLSIERFNEDPDEALEAGRRPIPFNVVNWRLLPLTVQTCEREEFLAKLPSAKVTVEVRLAPIDASRRNLDFDLSRVDGRAVLGRDGLMILGDPSRPSPRTNLDGALYVSTVDVTIRGTTQSLPQMPEPGTQISTAQTSKVQPPFLLSPHLAPYPPGPGCDLAAWWAPAVGAAVIRIFGGDGAGSYEAWLFFDATGFRGMIRNWCHSPESFCAMGQLPFNTPGPRPEFQRLHLQE